MDTPGLGIGGWGRILGHRTEALASSVKGVTLEQRLEPETSEPGPGPVQPDLIK